MNSPGFRSPITALDCAGRRLDLTRTAVMGILNVTPDSFSDGGRFSAADTGVRHAVAMAEDGADIIDIGGESTRPGAQAVSAAEQLDRVSAIVERVHGETDLPISIDTSDPSVMRETVRLGAGLINDIRALTEPGALEEAARLEVPVCVMHMQGTPQTMQDNPEYSDVVEDILTWLRARRDACEAAGIPRQRLVVDPGFGFGKSTRHNLELLDGLARFGALGCPVLAGLSRKGMISVLLKLPVDERMHASVALALLAAQRGAAIVRVHDVRATRDAIRMLEAVDPARRGDILSGIES